MARVADGLLALWILFIGIVYFGAYFQPQLWLSTSDVALKIYGAVLLAAVLTLCWRWLRRPQNKD